MNPGPIHTAASVGVTFKTTMANTNDAVTITDATATGVFTGGAAPVFALLNPTVNGFTITVRNPTGTGNPVTAPAVGVVVVVDRIVITDQNP
jgi:hypothetical protein